MSNFIRIGDGDTWINTELISYIRLDSPSAEKYQDQYICRYYEVQTEQPYTTRHDTREAALEEIKRVIGVTDL